MKIEIPNLNKCKAQLARYTGADFLQSDHNLYGINCQKLRANSSELIHRK